MGEYILYHAKIWTAENDAEWADAMSSVYDKMVPSVISQDVVDLIKATQE